MISEAFAQEVSTPQPTPTTTTTSANDWVSLIVGPAGAVIILALMGYATYRALIQTAAWAGERADRFGGWAAEKLEKWVEGFLTQIEKITSQNKDLIMQNKEDLKIYQEESEKNRHLYQEESEKDRKILSQSIEILAMELKEVKTCQTRTDAKINQILDRVSS